MKTKQSSKSKVAVKVVAVAFAITAFGAQAQAERIQCDQIHGVYWKQAPSSGSLLNGGYLSTYHYGSLSGYTWTMHTTYQIVGGKMTTRQWCYRFKEEDINRLPDGSCKTGYLFNGLKCTKMELSVKPDLVFTPAESSSLNVPSQPSNQLPAPPVRSTLIRSILSK